MPEANLSSSQMSAKETTHIQKSLNPRQQSFQIAPHFGLPQALDLAADINKSSPFFLPTHSSSLIAAIVGGVINFNGDKLVMQSDLKSLHGGWSAPENNFLSNFTIDAYLKILQRASAADGVKVETFFWEMFESGVSKMPVEAVIKGKSPLLQQDFILVPCNDLASKHWFLLVVLPKQKCMVILDSLAGNQVKPTAVAALTKMWNLLQSIDNTLNINHWRFVANRRDEIPQQGNCIDCDVFICLYARCLINKDVMIQQSDITDFRKYMILELHHNTLYVIPPEPIIAERYYAVDYVNQYYIGRALDGDNSFTKFKFLHKDCCSKKFYWPGHDDIAKQHNSCVFYGPVELEGNGPFRVVAIEELEKVFRFLNKQGTLPLN